MKNFVKNIFFQLFKFFGYRVEFYTLKNIFIVSKATQIKLDLIVKTIDKVHYGSAKKLMQGWMNIDMNYPTKLDSEPYILNYNLTLKHPFANETFSYAYSEDFIDTGDLQKLGVKFRTLKPKGVLRLSYPGFEELLKNHFHTIEYDFFKKEVDNTYNSFGHKHHFTKEELTLIVKHIGFSSITFTEYGASEYPILKNLETRDNQIGHNVYVEIQK